MLFYQRKMLKLLNIAETIKNNSLMLNNNLSEFKEKLYLMN